MNKKPKVLLTNDDGIHAKGLHTLWDSVKDITHPTIIAPTSEKSGTGLGQSLNKPLKIHPIVWESDTPAWAINGTPTDCVKLGFHAVLKEKPDLILSGINRGSNAGRCVLYSGTIGGVIEGVLKKVPGIAFSCFDFDNTKYEETITIIPKIIQYFLEHTIPEGSFINVNFPPGHLKIKGVKLARQGRSLWAEDPDARKHPTNDTLYYWLGGKWMDLDEHPESDVALLREGYVTVVPIYVEELTHHEHFAKHQLQFEKHLFDTMQTL